MERMIFILIFFFYYLQSYNSLEYWHNLEGGQRGKVNLPKVNIACFLVLAGGVIRIGYHRLELSLWINCFFFWVKERKG